MTEPAALAACPYLGLASDRTLVRTHADGAHRCYAQTSPGSPDAAHQAAYCLAAAHLTCPFYPHADTPAAGVPAAAAGVPAAAAQAAGGRRRRQWLTYLPWAALALLLIVVAVVYGRDILLSRAPGTSVVAVAPLTGTATAPPSGRAVASPALAPPTKLASTAPRATNTPEPGGQTLALAPKAGDAGWWASGEPRGNHLGDSYMYSGNSGAQAFVSAMRFELGRIPRGAPIREAVLRLTGLRADRFRPEAGGVWQVQLLPAEAVKDLARADFQTLFNAPPAVTLFPAFVPADLAENGVQELRLDAGARAWLAEQVAAGAPGVIARISGPAAGDTLFAWDSGAGPATGGNGPQLVLSMGPAPATPPPLPSQQVIVATSTPTPANILTVAADRLTATNVARTVGTVTPPPFRIVTPTPLPANVATDQAQRSAQGLPPVVIYTPTPANAATAAANAAYATAVAVTTGTFTPVPTHAVTPIVVLPTLVPENVVTAAAQILEATRRAAADGTATPLPFNAVVATVTPSPFVVANTPTPGNALTAVAQRMYMTAIAFATGTATPLPPNAMTPTPIPPLPLLLYEDQMTPRPAPTPTPVAPSSMPAALAGKLLFWSDRDGAPGVYALDVPSGRVALVTQAWPYPLAMATEPLTRDGRYRVFVRNADTEVRDRITGLTDRVSSPQLFVEDREFKTQRQLTTGASWSYDPVWSPQGDRIAYVSTEPGNDEIFVINVNGGEPRRLTSNTWEWDKHPTWSPDGNQIVFYSNRGTGRRQLWIMNADGSGQRPLMESPANDWDPIWVK